MNIKNNGWMTDGKIFPDGKFLVSPPQLKRLEAVPALNIGIYSVDNVFILAICHVLGLIMIIIHI